jgi:glycosyltransferase involved in cell wall biosynthesis
MRVCFICCELPPAPGGGIGPCVLTTARGLRDAGHEVVVLGSYERPYDWNEPGVRVEAVLPESRSWRLPFRGRTRIRQRLAELHRRTPLDVVEWPDYQGLFLWNLPGTVDVVRNHGTGISHRLHGLRARAPVQEYMERRTLLRIPNWIGVSRWFMDEFLGITGAHPSRSTVVYNPVDTGVFCPGDTPRDPGLILYAGAVSERKGAFALARAAREFLPRLPHARLVYVGSEHFPGGRARVLAEAGDDAARQIEFINPLPQDELAGWMRRAAVFAMPSILESFGNVWAEAMASGTPVLGSALTAGPEVVPHGEAGLLVNPGNPAGVAEAVMRLMGDPELRERMGRRGREVALARYSTAVGIPETIRFYRECLGDHPIRRKTTSRDAV